jgi:2-dehydropantoate 2-reductase
VNGVIAIVGTGAIGGYYGGRLAQHGEEVHFLFRSGLEAVRRRGLVVKSADGDFTLPPDRLHVHARAAEMPKADLVVVTLKSTANDQYEALIGPLVKESTVILTLQNGLGNEERLAELFGAERVMGGLAFICVNRQADGSIRHLDHGQIKLGEFSGPPRGRTGEIAKMFSASGVPCQVLEDLRYGRWEKLVWNVPFNGLGAVLDKSTDQLLASPDGLRLVKRLMEEVIQIAAGQGLHMPPELPDRKIADTHSMGAYRTSMQIDRQENRPMEIDSILGRPLAAAAAYGIASPYLQMLYGLATILSGGRADLARKFS